MKPSCDGLQLAPRPPRAVHSGSRHENAGWRYGISRASFVSYHIQWL